MQHSQREAIPAIEGVMATLLLNSNCHPLSLPLPARAFVTPRHTRIPPAFCFSRDLFIRRKRDLTVVAGAGPSSSGYMFAFVFPLSLLAVTVFASIRMADKLDQDFLEELRINQAVGEGDEGEDPDTSFPVIPLREDRVASRSRNRPKREV
ncbi:hypothetical protein SAY87_011052 [Trapa incisa]|uniref:High chlorophyll fluorescence 153 n=1 Tax=Trapa incisa TaxID=236973 RepID=A0AAN7GF22_9MYRT|nr:hypothetical protein SAY87_011052 [Trapa incisa]